MLFTVSILHFTTRSPLESAKVELMGTFTSPTERDTSSTELKLMSAWMEKLPPLELRLSTLGETIISIELSVARTVLYSDITRITKIINPFAASFTDFFTITPLCINIGFTLLF